MKRLLLPFLAVLPAFAQCPTGTLYPGALDTNSSLTVAKNNITTTLTVQQQITDTVAIVASTTGFVANMMIVVDTGTAIEYEFVNSVSGGNTLNVARACESSTAVIHIVGAPVANVISAYSGHTSVTGAVTALETLIKAAPTAHNVPIAEGTSPFSYISPGVSGQVLSSNGTSADPSFVPFANILPAGTQTQYLRLQPNAGNNTTPQFASFAQFNAADYNFPAQSPGGSLIVGNNTITMTPVPLGVNGTDTGHTMYVSGGTGTAESCLITGGSGTAGQASGSIIINCANTHSGAWTVAPNWLGVQEAVQAACTAGNGGVIQIGPGGLTVHGTLTIPCSGILISGTGQNGTSIFQNTPNVNMITTTGSPTNNGLTIQYLSLNDAVSTTAGALVNLNNTFQPKVQFAALNQGFNGIHVTAGSIQALFLNVLINNQVQTGILADGSNNNQGFFITNSNMGGQGTSCITLSAGGVGTRGVDLFNCNRGMLINPSGSQTVVNSFFIDTYFDTNANQGVLIQPAAAAVVQSLYFSACWSVSNTNGVLMDSTNGTINNIQWNGGIVALNKSGGITLTGPTTTNIMLENAIIGANSQMTAGTFAGINVGGTISHLMIENNLLGSLAPNNGQFCDICLGGTETNTIIQGNLFRGVDSGTIVLQGGPTLTNPYFVNNPGYNPIGVSAITVTASPFTFTAGSSPTTVYIQGGTISSITRQGTLIANVAPTTGQSYAIPLAPNKAIVVTYTVAPTMFQDIQ